jgi:alkylation response protein AidB-like acyl-CoA dehydrogenase
MDFAYSREQTEFRSSLRRFLAERVPSSRMREFAEKRIHDAEAWRRLCAEFGVPGLHVAEGLGGSGFSFEETAIVFEELGRALTPVPLAASTFAIEAILRLGTDEQRATLLPDLLSGDRVGAAALSDPRRLDSTGARVRADQIGDTHVLNGKVAHVVHGDVADLLVVPAVAEGSVHLWVVESTAAGVSIAQMNTLDITRPVAEVVMRDTPATLLPGPVEQLQKVIDIARVLLAAEMVGAAEACLALAVDYAQQRVQFNRPIGSFQAVKHHCANMAIELDASRSAAMYAAFVAATDHPDLRVVAPLAKAQAADTLTLCAATMMQVLGGIGFTWEHDAHLYYRRAKSTEAMLGSSAQHRALLAERVGI